MRNVEEYALHHPVVGHSDSYDYKPMIHGRLFYWARRLSTVRTLNRVCSIPSTVHHVTSTQRTAHQLNSIQRRETGKADVFMPMIESKSKPIPPFFHQSLCCCNVSINTLFTWQEYVTLNRTWWVDAIRTKTPSCEETIFCSSSLDNCWW